jgi:hypothetical protein
MSTGPLLHFRINNALPGQDIELAANGGMLDIEARAVSIAPLSKVVIYRNGQTWKEVSPSGVKESVRVTESGWYALYAEGPPYTWLDAEYPQALTNAIRVYVGDGKIRNRESAEYFTRWVNKLRGLAEEWLWWRSDREKEHVFAQFEEARKKYAELAAEAQAGR